MITEGWLLDVLVSRARNKVTLWFKQRNGVVKPIHVSYNPAFYLHITDGMMWSSLEQLRRAVLQHPNVVEAEPVFRYIRLGDDRPTQVLEVHSDGVKHHRKAIDDIVALGGTYHYNVDVMLDQLFLYESHLFPLCYAIVDVKSGRLCSSQALESRWTIEYDPPPLDIAELQIQTSSRRKVPLVDDQIEAISLIVDGEETIVEDRSEADLLLEFVRTLQGLDPDLLLTSGGDDFLFPHITARSHRHGLRHDMILGRDNGPLFMKAGLNRPPPTSYISYGIVFARSRGGVYLNGRLHIDTDNAFTYKDGKVDGGIEVARLTIVPFQRACRVTIGSSMTSIQLYEAWKRGILIPPIKRNTEYFKTGMQLLAADRGGFVFTPKLGIFEEVGECDFSSMYPYIMYRRNLSPETVLCQCCRGAPEVPGTDFHVCNRRQGLIPQSIRILLEKRKAYKVLGKTHPRYDHMQKTIKWILVTCFGYLGFKNSRFGRVEAHMATTAFARDILLRSSDYFMDRGFDVLHGIVDCLWLRKRDTSMEEYERLCQEVSRQVDVPLTFEGVFNWVVFLPSRQDSRLPVRNRYYGVFRDGSVKVRGIELRRRDTIPLIKQAQGEMISELAKARNKEEFIDRIPAARRVLNKYIDMVREKRVDIEDLMIRRRLSRDIEAYQAATYQSIAARQLLSQGIRAIAGQNVSYVIVNASAKNPMQRVIASQLASGGYDVAKYEELLQRAFSNVIPPTMESEPTSNDKKLTSFG